MNIQENQEKRKWGGWESAKRLFVPVSIILVAIAGYGLGAYSKMAKNQPAAAVIPAPEEAVTLPKTEEKTLAPAPEKTAAKSGTFVASKTGTAYYFPWCASVKRIKEENKIWFETKEAAEKAGYKPALNCKGMK